MAAGPGLSRRRRRHPAHIRAALHCAAAAFFELQVVMRDRQTGRPRGFGFVTFTMPEAADRVVEDIHVIDGRQVRTCFSCARPASAARAASLASMWWKVQAPSFSLVSDAQ